MKKNSLKLRGATALAFTGVCATLWACSGDSGSTDDGGSGGDTATGSSSSGSGSGSGSSSSGSGSSSGGRDGGSSGSSSGSGSGSSSGSSSSSCSSSSSSGGSGGDSGLDAPRDAPVDSRVDSTVDSSTGDGGDATVTDAAPEAATDAGMEAEAAPPPPPPLQMCPLLDSDWGIGPYTAPDGGADSGDAGAVCPTRTTDTCGTDRTNNWVSDIVQAFATGAINQDCRIKGMLATLTATTGPEYSNAQSIWTLSFFGCPQPSDGGVLPFGLIPPSLSGHVFSTADLKLLSDWYVQAIKDAIASPSSGTTPPALSQSQIDMISAQLAAQAAAVPGTTTSTAYTFDSCPADAGNDGSSDGSSDGGADSGGG